MGARVLYFTGLPTKRPKAIGSLGWQCSAVIDRAADVVKICIQFMQARPWRALQMIHPRT
jgi:hypothetical protein